MASRATFGDFPRNLCAREGYSTAVSSFFDPDDNDRFCREHTCSFRQCRNACDGEERIFCVDHKCYVSYCNQHAIITTRHDNPITMPNVGYDNGYPMPSSGYDDGLVRPTHWYCDRRKSAEHYVYLTAFNHREDQCGIQDCQVQKASNDPYCSVHICSKSGCQSRPLIDLEDTEPITLCKKHFIESIRRRR